MTTGVDSSGHLPPDDRPPEESRHVPAARRTADDHGNPLPAVPAAPLPPPPPRPPSPRRSDGPPLFPTPETVAVSVAPADIQPGPADDRMFVVDAIGKLPYNQLTGPPGRGLKHPPVQPGPDGHFTHLDPDSREFSAATMYATVRRVLDIWQDYFGHRIDWSFESDFARLELIPLIEWDNAQSGFGFLQLGFRRTLHGTIAHTPPHCQHSA